MSLGLGVAAKLAPQPAAICQRGRQAVTDMFKQARLGHTVHAEQCLPLVDEICASVQRNPGALISLARPGTQHRIVGREEGAGA